MDTRTRYILIGALILIALIVIWFLIQNSHKASIRKELDDINVRFNKIQTVPLAFKLNKAKAIAKIDAETSSTVEDYYQKYETAQKNLDQLQELINGIEDSLAGRKYSDARKAVNIVNENLKDSEEEVNEIDRFLDRFVEQENKQREYANGLKEQFRNLKLRIHDKENELNYSLEGINERLAACEKLFSSAEDWMYGNEYAEAQQNLEMIEKSIIDINGSIDEIPDLVQEARGVIPVMDDELRRQYALSTQRGIFLTHLNLDEELNKNDELLKKDLRLLLKGETGGVREDLAVIKQSLSDALNKVKTENDAYRDLRKASDTIRDEVGAFKKIVNYLEVVYDKEKERYNLNELEDVLRVQKENVNRYQNRYEEFEQKIAKNEEAASGILADAAKMFEALRKDKDYLKEIKGKIDKTSNGEARAISQVMKLQVVLNEVEVKIAQYRLPAISDAYKADLEKGHEYVGEIKSILAEIPLRIDYLNSVLDEAIDFIYKLYNNVNNVIGMAVMVENAIVFGNKYRSTHPEIDRELSRAEFSYLNGEYTQALMTALSCMETLFPNSIDDKILENAKSAA